MISPTNWRQIGFATFTQNVATGLVFGSFGTLVLAIEQEYGASRSQSSLSISILVVSLSLTAAMLGRLLEDVSIRKVMAAGALLSAVGFALLSVVAGPYQLLLCYGLVLGPATAMLGVLPSMTLAARWSGANRRGLAMGLVNAPLFVMIVPLAIAPLLETYGIRTIYRGLALLDLCVVPLILAAIRDGRTKSVSEEGSSSEKAGKSGILKTPIFWLLVLGQGILAGAGIMKLAHFVPLLTELGRTFDEANLLFAISGGAGLIGTLAFGAIADRIGGAAALALNGFVQALVWTIFLMPVSFPVLFVDAIIVGACGAGIQAAFGAALVTLFGPEQFSRAFGLATILTLPFLFGLTPAAGILYEASGSYFLPMGLMVATLGVAGILFALAARSDRRSRRIMASAGIMGE